MKLLDFLKSHETYIFSDIDESRSTPEDIISLHSNYNSVEIGSYGNYWDDIKDYCNTLKDKTFLFGLKRVEIEGRMYFVNKDGDFLESNGKVLNFHKAWGFYHGFAKVRTFDDGWNFIDTSGNFLVNNPTLSNITTSFNDLCPDWVIVEFCETNEISKNTYGYLHKSGVFLKDKSGNIINTRDTAIYTPSVYPELKQTFFLQTKVNPFINRVLDEQGNCWIVPMDVIFNVQTNNVNYIISKFFTGSST